MTPVKLTRQEFVALWQQMLDDDDKVEGFNNEGGCWHFGKQHLRFLTDALYGEPPMTIERPIKMIRSNNCPQIEKAEAWLRSLNTEGESSYEW